MLRKDVEDRVRRRVVNHVLYHGEDSEFPTLHEGHIDPDGRSVKKSVRDLLDREWIEHTSSKTMYRLTPRAYQYVQALPADPAEWRVNTFYINTPTSYRPIIAADASERGLACCYVKYLIGGEAQDLEWYVVPEEYFLEQHWDRVKGPMFGPYTLEEARKALQEAGRQHPMTDFRLGISTPAVRERVRERLFTESLKIYLETHQISGLVKLGIITEEETEFFTEGRGSGLGSPITLTHLPDKKDSEQWEDQITKEINQKLDSMIRLQQSLRAALKLKEGIRKLGGWSVFLEKFREVVTEEWNSRKEQSLNEEPNINALPQNRKEAVLAGS